MSKYRFQIVFVCHPGPKLGNAWPTPKSSSGAPTSNFHPNIGWRPKKKVFTSSDVFCKVIIWNCHSKVTVKDVSTLEKIFHTFYPLLVSVKVITNPCLRKNWMSEGMKSYFFIFFGLHQILGGKLDVGRREALVEMCYQSFTSSNYQQDIPSKIAPFEINFLRYLSEIFTYIPTSKCFY